MRESRDTDCHTLNVSTQSPYPVVDPDYSVYEMIEKEIGQHKPMSTSMKKSAR